MDKEIVVKQVQEKFGQYLVVDIMILQFMVIYEISFKGKEIWSFNPKNTGMSFLSGMEESTVWVTDNLKDLEKYLINECPETKLLFLYR